jgi:hypothetical protein
MAWTLIAHAISPGSGGGTGTTSGIDTTGANLIVLGVAEAAAIGGNPHTPSDSKSNTWTSGPHFETDTVSAAIWYAYAPTVGSGHTFSTNAVGVFGAVAVLAFSGSASSPSDKTNSNGSSLGPFTTLQPGSITPAEDHEMIVTAFCGRTGSGSLSINSSFTVSDSIDYAGGVNESLGLAYLDQTTAGAINPTWTTASTDSVSAAINSFKGSAEALMAAMVM